MDAEEHRQRVIARIEAALGEKFGAEFTAIARDQRLEAAGLDSVDLLDALAAVEKLFGIALEQEDLVGIGTLDELYVVVYDRLLDERGEDFSIP